MLYDQQHHQSAIAPRNQFGLLTLLCGALLLLTAVGAGAQTAPSVQLAWDPNPGDIAGYRVYYGVASRNYTNVLDVGNVTTAWLSNLVAGVTYYIAVTAYNSYDLESQFSAEISYTPAITSAPGIALSSPADGTSFTSPATIPMTATLTANGHIIKKVQFLSGGNLLGEVYSSPYTLYWNNVQAGVYSLAATLVYDNGATLSSGAITVTVTNPPPVIVLSSPADGASFTAPANVPLSASVAPNGHSITKVQFFNGSTLLAEDTASPYVYTADNLPAGNYTLSATAVYDSGNTVSSAPASITVAAAPPPPPGTITFAADSGTITPPFVAQNGVVSQDVETGPTDGGRAAYTFSVPSTCDYLVSANVSAPNDGANSFYVNTDAEPTDPFMIWDMAVNSGFSPQNVNWRGNGTFDADQYTPKVFNLAQGSHTLIVRGREAGAQLGAITISPANVLPPPWQTIDIGAVGVTGNAGLTNGVYTLSGAGAIGGSSGSLRFLYQPMTGDGEIRAHIASMQNSGANGLVGVMMRETLSPGSQYAFMGLAPDGSYTASWRIGTATPAISSVDGSGTAPDTWVRIVRVGNVFYGYTSADGWNWTSAIWGTVPMTSTINFGFAVSSGSSGVLSTATFDNATIVP